MNELEIIEQKINLLEAKKREKYMPNTYGFKGKGKVWYASYIRAGNTPEQAEAKVIYRTNKIKQKKEKKTTKMRASWFRNFVKRYNIDEQTQIPLKTYFDQGLSLQQGMKKIKRERAELSTKEKSKQHNFSEQQTFTSPNYLLNPNQINFLGQQTFSPTNSSSSSSCSLESNFEIPQASTSQSKCGFPQTISPQDDFYMPSNKPRQRTNFGNNICTRIQDAETNHSSNNAKKFVRVAVVPKNYPHEILETEQLNVLENAIIEEVARGWEAELLFHGINFGSGMLLVDCKNSETVKWLHHIVPQLHSWRGMELTACLEDDLPKLRIISIYLPNSGNQDLKSTMALISLDNGDLNIQEWKVLSKNSDGRDLYIKFAIDNHSYNTIQKKGSIIRYGFGTAPVQLTP